MMNYIDKLLKQDIYPHEILNDFYLSPVLSEDLKKYTEVELELATDRLISILIGTKVEDILIVIEANRNRIVEITSANIPQFSNIDAINEVLDYVVSADEITYELIGYYINKDAKKGAQTKYGENHYKMAAAIGLTTAERPFAVTMLGSKYMRLTKKEKISLRNKLFLLVPIVQQIIIAAKYREIQPMQILRLYLSESTSVRRRANVRTMVEYVYKDAGVELATEIKKNLDWK